MHVAAGVYGEPFENGTEVFQVQVVHDARPAVTYQVTTTFQAYIRHCDPTFPSELREFEEQWRAKLVLTNDEDEDAVGFHACRVAWYNAGDSETLKNLCLFLDSYFRLLCDRNEEPTFTKVVDVTWHVDTSLGDSIDTQKYMRPTVCETGDAATFAVNVLDAQPPQYKRRLVAIDFEAVSSTSLDMVFCGLTYPFYVVFAAAGIQTNTSAC